MKTSFRRLQSCKVNTTTNVGDSPRLASHPAQVNQPGCSLPVRSVKFTAEELQFYTGKALSHLNHHSKCRMKVAEAKFSITSSAGLLEDSSETWDSPITCKPETAYRCLFQIRCQSKQERLRSSVTQKRTYFGQLPMSTMLFQKAVHMDVTEVVGNSSSISASATMIHTKAPKRLVHMFFTCKKE
ncbi:uncharacterized protein LOC142602812 [Balearica regulorum gibbericeps]|uniref:uncharacterized protein LOC142602812 n=1 Tax=Balearica regulorum gibbericeps TaxID=100784 RepID=UPI003F61DF18